MATRTTFSPTKSYLLDSLRSDVVVIQFTKTDGTERFMTCTLKEDLIEKYEKKTDREKAVNEDVISVWDVEKNGWRSFRYDSVISVFV